MKFQDVLFFQNSICFLVFTGQGGGGREGWEGCKTRKNDPITNFNLSDSISQEL